MSEYIDKAVEILSTHPFGVDLKTGTQLKVHADYARAMMTLLVSRGIAIVSLDDMEHVKRENELLGKALVDMTDKMEADASLFALLERLEAATRQLFTASTDGRIDRAVGPALDCVKILGELALARKARLT